MHTYPEIDSDARTATILRGNTWALNFLIFALLVDIMYRSLAFGEAAWDLFAFIGISGVISVLYAAQHSVVLILNRKSIAVVLLSGAVALVVAALVAMMSAM